MPFTAEQLTAMRGGLTAEEYRCKLMSGISAYMWPSGMKSIIVLGLEQKGLSD